MIEPPPDLTRNRPLLLIPVLALIFAVALFFFSEKNGFPYQYHPDEPAKVRQIITGERTFYHPLLMLTTADWAVQILGTPLEPQAVVVIGRWCSAIFAAATVVMLCLLAWRWSGWTALLIGALLLIAHAQFYELAHYFKEDPALVMGLAAAFLAADFYQARPSCARALATGAACGLALSGKYIGIVILFFILPIIFLKAPRQRWKMLACTLLGVALVWSLFNYPALRDFGKIHDGLSREIAKTDSPELAHTHFLNLDFLQRTKHLTPPLAWIGLLALPALLHFKKQKPSLVQVSAFLFPLVFLFMLLFWPKSSDRYLLPVVVFLIFNSLPGLAGLLWIAPAHRVISAGLALLAIALYVVSSGAAFREARESLRIDQRAQLRQWLLAHTSADACFATDKVVHLEADPAWTQRRFYTSGYTVADFGTLASLRQKGVTHIIMSRQSDDQFMSAKLKSKKTLKSSRATFFEELRHHSKKIWSEKSRTNACLNPGMTVYELDRVD